MRNLIPVSKAVCLLMPLLLIAASIPGCAAVFSPELAFGWDQKVKLQRPEGFAEQKLPVKVVLWHVDCHFQRKTPLGGYDEVDVPEARYNPPESLFVKSNYGVDDQAILGLATRRHTDIVKLIAEELNASELFRCIAIKPDAGSGLSAHSHMRNIAYVKDLPTSTDVELAIGTADWDALICVGASFGTYADYNWAAGIRFIAYGRDSHEMFRSMLATTGDWPKRTFSSNQWSTIANESWPEISRMTRQGVRDMVEAVKGELEKAESATNP